MICNWEVLEIWLVIVVSKIKNVYILDWWLVGYSYNFFLYNKNYEEKNYDVIKVVLW